MTRIPGENEDIQRGSDDGHDGGFSHLEDAMDAVFP